MTEKELQEIERKLRESQDGEDCWKLHHDSIYLPLEPDHVRALIAEVRKYHRLYCIEGHYYINDSEPPQAERIVTSIEHADGVVTYTIADRNK